MRCRERKSLRCQYVVFLSSLYWEELVFRILLLSSLSWSCAISPCVVFSTFARPNWANRFCRGYHASIAS
jgi:hypothetical protein